MDEELLAELRHRAVDAHMSLSAWITTTIKGVLPSTTGIDEVREGAIARMERGFHLGGGAMSRDEIHAR
jgi:hypothetical protein